LISVEKALPAIPAKRYFTIGEVSELCGVKPYVLRYWEQEFTQLKPMKRRGNRRYYQHHEVLLIRRIRGLLYDQGFTISGARNRLAEAQGPQRGAVAVAMEAADEQVDDGPSDEDLGPDGVDTAVSGAAPDTENERMPLEAEGTEQAPTVASAGPVPYTPEQLRKELLSIRELLLEQ
jgi:DNA-binding transcriptional MerR regulator